VTADRARHPQPTQLRLATVPAGVDTVRLTVGGEVDIGTVDPLHDTLLALVHDPRVRGVEVDLSEVTFVDSTGVATLMAAYRAAEARRVALVLTRCRPQALRVLEITGVDKVLMPGSQRRHG